ncbi:MAG TPA: hypothetical protein VF077_00385 [Nitrospiraceae bacterium]
MIVPVPSIAEVGYNADLPTQRLPLPAWTGVRNAAFRDALVETAIPFQATTLASTGHTWIQVFQPIDGLAAAYGGPTKLYGTDFETHGEITRASGVYTGAVGDYWNGDTFHSFGIMTNGVDVPQVWNPMGPGTPLIDMPAWPSTVRAKVVRGFMNFLVALDITKGGIRNKRMVKWSHSADPNTLPSSWDETDASKDAGEVLLYGGEEPLIDCLPLGDVNIIYSGLQTWSQTYVGGQSIFAFRRLFSLNGILAQQCASALPSGHFVVTADDMIIHNGASINSVADRATRKWFFNNLSAANFLMTRVIRYLQNREMWICFPSYGAALDLALVWNWRYNTWTVRELPNMQGVSNMPNTPGTKPDPWADPVYTWDGETVQPWGNPIVYRQTEKLVFIGTSSFSVMQRVTLDPPVVKVTLEKSGIAFIDAESTDEYNYKKVIAVRPSFAGKDGQIVTISVGFQENIEDVITWTETGTFVIGTDVELQLNAVGRYLAVKFEWEEGGDAIKFYGYGLDIVLLKEGL